MLIVRKGPTSHLPLHDNDRRQRQQTDTTEIPPTEILGRIFTETSHHVTTANNMLLRAVAAAGLLAHSSKEFSGSYLTSLPRPDGTFSSPPPPQWSVAEPPAFASESALVAYYQPYCAGRVEVLSLDPPLVLLHEFLSSDDCKG